MTIDYMVLADAAAAENGKHYIHGGGWDTIWAGSFPVAHPMMAIAARFRVPWNDTNQAHKIAIDVLNDDGQSILTNPPQSQITVGRPPTIPVGNDQVLPFAFNLANLSFERAGDYVAVIRVDDADQARSPFRVAEAQTGGSIRAA